MSPRIIQIETPYFRRNRPFAVGCYGPKGSEKERQGLQGIGESKTTICLRRHCWVVFKRKTSKKSCVCLCHSWTLCLFVLFRPLRCSTKSRIISLKAADLIFPYLSEGAVKAPPTPAETPVLVSERCFQTAIAITPSPFASRSTSKKQI